MIISYNEKEFFKLIDEKFLETRGRIPSGGGDRYYFFKPLFYNYKRDFRPQNNLFDSYEEDMVHCKWCEFLGLDPIHPFSYIKFPPSWPKWPYGECERMVKYRNHIRTAEELKVSTSGRIIENILGLYMADIDQQIYKKNELEEYCLDIYGGCFMTGEKEFSIDHILPLNMGYPLTFKNACPLIKTHNSAKSDKWPCDFYNNEELIRLSKLSGYTVEVLKTPQMNYPFFDWCNDNPSAWRDYVNKDRKYLQEYGGKERFIESFQEKIDLSIIEQKQAGIV